MQTTASGEKRVVGVILFDPNPAVNQKFSIVVKKNLQKKFPNVVFKYYYVNSVREISRVVVDLKQRQAEVKILAFVSADTGDSNSYSEIDDLLELQILSRWELVVMSNNRQMIQFADRLGVRFLGKPINAFSLPDTIVKFLRIDASHDHDSGRPGELHWLSRWNNGGFLF